MKYQESVYDDFSSFLAEATQIAKDKISLYNTLIDPPTRKNIEGNTFRKIIDLIIFILKTIGWYAYIIIAGLLGLGLLGFYGGMGAFLAANPVLAAATAVLTGGGIYLLWKKRDVYLAHAEVGKRYKKDFDGILRNYPERDARKPHIHSLLRKCVKSICVEVFTINSDEFMEKVYEDMYQEPMGAMG